MKLNELAAVAEALLFLSGDPVPLTTIAQVIDMDAATTKAILRNMAEEYVKERRGLRLLEIDGAYQLGTAAECFSYLRNHVQPQQRPGLTQALLETLSIVAYKQPITKAQIEEIRGVSAEHAINRLMERGLVCEVGRQNAPGKPALFGTTRAFLRAFGFRTLEEMPVLSPAKVPDLAQNLE